MKNWITMTERILNITLEIIYLLAGEEYELVTKTSIEHGTPRSCPRAFHERINDKKILQLTNKIIDLLTGEDYQEELEGPCVTSVEREDNLPLPPLTPRPEVHRSSFGCNISNSLVNTAVLTSQTRIQQEPNSCDATTSIISKEKSNSNKREAGGTDVPTASLTRQTQCNSTQIKEESISSEENDLARPSSPMHIEYLSVTVKEECCEGEGSGLSDSDNEVTQEAVEKLGFPECEKSFSSMEKLIRYQASDLDSKGSECLECGKFFSKKCNLRVHQRSHRGEKPFSCAECKQSFSVKSTLVRHLRIHSGEKPFACPICGKCFRQSQSLVAHQRSHTGEKPFTCPVCEKSFSSSQYLVAHQRSHTGERPYPCPECGKCFSKKPTLVIHRRIHLGKKP
ncbi:uncharacterized protein LOC143956339 [Lithobates pipiens]